MFYKHDTVQKERDAFISTGQCNFDNINPNIADSWLRSKSLKINPHAQTLPPVPPIEETANLVTDYSKYIKKVFLDFYERKHLLLDSIGVAMFYIDKDMNIYIRAGNRNLTNQLKTINLRFGANLSENIIGTNAAALAARNQRESWVIGAEHYVDALQDYFCAAVPASGQYQRAVYIMLIAPMNKMNKQMIDLFRFILGTENTLGDALHTLDLPIKEELATMTMEENSSMFIITDPEGIITSANDQFFDNIGATLPDTLGKNINEILPEMGTIMASLKNGRNISTQELYLPQLHTMDKTFYISGKLVKKNGQNLGMVVTFSSKHNIQSIINKVVNFSARFTFDDLLGNDSSFLRVKKVAQEAANSTSNVLIFGESGTGKELFAHAIHNASRRNNKPFITINCAAIPKELIGSELFGYVEGAFTGARKGGAAGKFELANGGTLFLDEIGEMPLDMQTVLLRVLEDKMVTRLGDNHATSVDVRFIAATNRDLFQMVEEGKFRLDLYYRLNVIKLDMVPLRKRANDIPLLANLFLEHFSQALHKKSTEFTPDAMELLKMYQWPGNIRELRNVIERIVNVSESKRIDINDIPDDIINSVIKPSLSNNVGSHDRPVLPTMKIELDIMEKEVIKELLRKYKGNKSQVAAELGIARSTLYRKLKSMDNYD